MSESLNNAYYALEKGEEYPYHDKRPADNAERIALGILYDLNDRAGIKHGFRGVDEEVRSDIVHALADIVRVGMAGLPAEAKPQVGEKWFCRFVDAVSTELWRRKVTALTDNTVELESLDYGLVPELEHGTKSRFLLSEILFVEKAE